MKRILWTLLFTAIAFAGHTQKGKTNIKFGKIDIENLKMDVYPLDSSAGAVILADVGLTTMDNAMKISYRRHTRIKILNSSEFDRADVRIPHFRGDMVSGLKAATYNLENGEIETSQLDKKKVTKVRDNEDIDVTSFGLPNVKEGSIIEYTYEVNYGSILRIMPWYFQYNIPVKYSEYQVILPEAFNYRPNMTGYIGLEESNEGFETIHLKGEPYRARKTQYIARNVPAFIEEPNITTADDYISKISFQLASIIVPGRVHEEYMNSSYLELSKEMAGYERYSSELDKSKFVGETVSRIISGKTTTEEKARAIYSWMQQNFTKGNHDEDNWSKIFDMREGNSYEINFIMIMMMREAGLKAEPVRISTRSNGMLHPYFPSSYNFNYLLCLVSDGENEYLLDASDDFLDFNMLGKKCLNGKGLVISEVNPRWVDLKPSRVNRQVVSSNIAIDKEGNVQGKVTIQRSGLTASEFRKANMEDPEQYQKNLKESLNEWSIEQHKMDGLQTLDKPVIETIDMEVPSYAESLGDIIYVDPILIGGVKENPYKLEERVYPVDYAAPFTNVISHTIQIPDGYSVDEIPEPMAMALPNNAGRFNYSVSVNGNVISVTSQLKISKTLFVQNEYPYLKAFYDKMVDKLQEQIVLKKTL